MPLKFNHKICNRLFSSSAILSIKASDLFSSAAKLTYGIQKRMPPKKAAAAEKKVLLGRPSNNLKVGIVGAFL
jgi:hypothetical protein